MKSGFPGTVPQAQRPLLALLPPAGEALERTREAVSQQNQALRGFLIPSELPGN
jgi:hypothetical protein